MQFFGLSILLGRPLLLGLRFALGGARAKQSLDGHGASVCFFSDQRRRQPSPTVEGPRHARPLWLCFARTPLRLLDLGTYQEVFLSQAILWICSRPGWGQASEATVLLRQPSQRLSRLSNPLQKRAPRSARLMRSRLFQERVVENSPETSPAPKAAPELAFLGS